MTSDLYQNGSVFNALPSEEPTGRKGAVHCSLCMRGSRALSKRSRKAALQLRSSRGLRKEQLRPAHLARTAKQLQSSGKRSLPGRRHVPFLCSWRTLESKPASWYFQIACGSLLAEHAAAEARHASARLAPLRYRQLQQPRRRQRQRGNAHGTGPPQPQWSSASAFMRGRQTSTSASQMWGGSRPSRRALPR